MPRDNESMKTHPTIAGQAYVVFSKTGCTVTDSTGSLNKAVPAGDWMTVPAPSDALILTDDNAIVRNANFSLAPTQSSVSEGGGTGEYVDIFPLSNVWTGTNAFFEDVTFYKKPTFPEGTVLSQTEADERYALKGEGGGGDSGLTPEQVEKLTLYASAEGRSITPALNLATEVGHTYTVTAKGSDVDVTASNGTPLCSVPAGSQLSFVAIGTTTKLSSTDCAITENFKGAAHVVLSGGGSSEGGSTGGSEPEGDYLTFDPNYTSVGGRLNTLADASYLAYKKSALTEWRVDLPAAKKTTGMCQDCSSLVVFTANVSASTDAQYMFLNCKKLLEWVGDLPELLNSQQMFKSCAVLTTFRGALSKLTSAVSMFDSCWVLSVFESQLPKLETATSMFVYCRKLAAFYCELPKVKTADKMFMGCSALRVFAVGFPSLTSGDNLFSETLLDRDSVLTICNSLPTYTSGTHKITLGIHTDHKFDPDVNAALKRLDANYEPLNLPIDEATGDYIEITESKRWTLSVQWNGTATENAYPNPAATYSLRPQIAPVYAKLGEDSDGKTFLDWGHYVTDWEENGYMEFASLEEAREYFNITE